jgi:hypothetical protein
MSDGRPSCGIQNGVTDIICGAIYTRLTVGEVFEEGHNLQMKGGLERCLLPWLVVGPRYRQGWEGFLRWLVEVIMGIIIFVRTRDSSAWVMSGEVAQAIRE